MKNVFYGVMLDMKNEKSHVCIKGFNRFVS